MTKATVPDQRFILLCPCGHQQDVSFSCILPTDYGMAVIFYCPKCGRLHKLGGRPEYRELQETPEGLSANIITSYERKKKKE